MTGGEGPWVHGNLTGVAPGLLVAGTNPVTTDAVSMALMGFDPMADRGVPPFEVCDSMLRLAEEAGWARATSSASKCWASPFKKRGSILRRSADKGAANLRRET